MIFFVFFLLRETFETRKLKFNNSPQLTKTLESHIANKAYTSSPQLSFEPNEVAIRKSTVYACTGFKCDTNSGYVVIYLYQGFVSS